MYREEMIQIRTLAALEDIIDTCATSAACYRCPFRMYTAHAIMTDHIYKASEICALYEIFGNVPRMIDTGALQQLFQEGRMKHRNEILYDEEAEGSERAGQPEDPSAPAADRCERDAEDPESDH